MQHHDMGCRNPLIKTSETYLSDVCDWYFRDHMTLTALMACMQVYLNIVHGLSYISKSQAPSIIRSAMGLPNTAARRAKIASISYICPSCALRLRPTRLAISTTITQLRFHSSADRTADWAKQAEEIANGRRKSMLQMLVDRGYINQVVG